MANDTLMGEKMMRHAIKLLPHAVVKRISEFLDPDPGLDWLFTMWAMDSPASNESERQSKGSPSRRRDLLRELTRACSSDGGMEYLDELLSEYLSLAQGNDASGWQATLLKAAIDHRNIIFIQLLLSCDPRGKIIRMHRLLEDIFTVLPNTNGTSAAVDILTGEEPMYAGLMWDITALQQAIDVSDNHLLCFLLEHVELPLEVLNDSFKYASQKKRGELAAMITSTISLIRWNKSLQGASTLPSIVYKEGELVFVQLPKGVHFWKGTIHRDCLNGTYDVQVVDYSSNPLLLQVEPSQLRPASKASIENRTRVIIEDIARATVTWIVCLASSDVLKRLKNDDFDPLQSAVINNSKKRDDDSDDLDENEDSSESGESESDSDCSSDCDCSDCHSECGSDCDCDVKHSNYTDNEDSNNDPVPAKPLPPIETRVQSDPLYLLPESDDGDRTIRLDADTVLGISSCESLYDDTESLCDEITEFKVVDAILLQAIVSPTEDIEASKSTNPQPAEIAHKVDADVAIVSDNQLTPAVINCPVAWASSTSDLFNTSDLRVGDDVDVRYQGRELYIRGRIVDADANKSGFDILYPDGQKETAVPREYIKQINSNGSKKQPEPQDDPEPQAIKPEAATSDSIASDTYARNTVQHGPSSDTVQPDQSDADLDTCYGNEESEKIASATDDAASNTVNAAGESEENSLISSTPSTEDVTADIPPPSPKIDNNYIVEKSQEILSSPTTEDVTADTPPSPKIDRNNIGYKCCNQCYRLGQEIEVNFLGIGKFHRAKIVHVHADNETYDVAFCNFDQIELGVTPTNIRALRVSTQRMKSLIVGSPSSVLPLDTAISTIESSIASSQIGLDVSHVQPEEIAEKSSEVRRPSRLAQVAPLSVPPPQRSVRTSGNSRAPTRRAGHDSARERQLSSTREIATSGEVEEWRNVDIILNRKRRLLHSITGSVETTKVPWGEEFASIQSLKRFATQHPDVLREHMYFSSMHVPSTAKV